MFHRFFHIDFIFLLTILLIVGFGGVAIGSIFLYGDNNSSIFYRHIIYVGVGLAVFFVLCFVDYALWRAISTYMYFFAVILLIVTLIFGTTVRGTSGWLVLGPITVQSVEIVKIMMIFFVARFIAEKRVVLGEMLSIIVSFVLVSIVGMLILLQPDFGSAVVVYGVWFCMIFVSGIKKRYLAAFVLIGIVTAFLSWQFFAPHQRARIVNFVHPELDPQGTGYNVLQSIIAVGNGGLFGQGFGYGSQSQLNFLPEKHTDFIFATIAESTGFVGAMILLTLFGVLFVRFYIIAGQSRDAFGYFVVVGVMALFLIHVLINIGMNIGVMPVTGIPLPLVSYGGSALLSFLIGCGVVMSVYIRREVTMKEYIESY